jgi:hypothetical protein
MRDTGWFKSSFSGGGTDNCVEVRIADSADSAAGSVGVRDSKNPGGGALSVTFDAWGAFLRRSASSFHAH